MTGPGAMTPPKYSPLAVIQSNVVAVPKSTTMEGPFQRAMAARALTIRSAPTSDGLRYRTFTLERVVPETKTGVKPVVLRITFLRFLLTDGTTLETIMPS